jgi:tetratricopeptide (TPR) repeat protein
MKRINEGLICYDRALEINPKDAQGWVNKGATLAEVGRIREALTSFREAERLGHPKASELVAFCRADPRSR